MAVLGQHGAGLSNSLWARAVPWAEVEALHRRIGRHFARSEPRDRARSYVLGLLAPLDRKNGRRLADFAEESRPDGMQRLLTRARWNADAVRDELQDYVRERFGHPSAILLLAEAAFEKRGSTSAGLGSHYDQAAGRFVKSQLGLFLAYKTAGRPVVLVDRRLYGATAGEPVAKAKANLAAEMVAGTRQRLPFRWLAGGDVFGTDRQLRARLEHERVPYIFTVPSSLRCLSDQDRTVVARRMNELLAARSDPWYRPQEDKSTVELFAPEWAKVPLCNQAGSDQLRFLLLRRDRRTRSLACFVCFGPADAELSELASASTAPLATDTAFQMAKRWAGLDQYQVRSPQAWYRHMTLAMMAYACLAVAVVNEQETLAPARSRLSPVS